MEFFFNPAHSVPTIYFKLRYNFPENFESENGILKRGVKNHYSEEI